MEYNYYEAVKADVLDAIRENYNMSDYINREDFEEVLNEDLFIDDAVTGNSSGSYTFSTWNAEEYLAHNWDLLEEAIDEFGGDTDILRKGPEACDVTIRCYLLGQAISEALDEVWEDQEEEAR